MVEILRISARAGYNQGKLVAQEVSCATRGTPESARCVAPNGQLGTNFNRRVGGHAGQASGSWSRPMRLVWLFVRFSGRCDYFRIGVLSRCNAGSCD